MNKRQAKKGRNAHGSWKKEKQIQKAYIDIYPIPRWRQLTKWIKKQWSYKRLMAKWEEEKDGRNQNPED